ncbi:MAG TPA: DUF1592 domain-containing protein [Pirellulaceae bacterium]|jgi:hypothetical protein
MNCGRISALLVALFWAVHCQADDPASTQKLVNKFVDAHCVDCHDKTTKAGGLDLDEAADVGIERNVEVWEKVVHKLAARQMPPREAKKPTEAEFNGAIALLETSLDKLAAANPNPGRTETFRRLNRTEYQNTIRDLLELDVDVTAMLPADESSHGFDNITVADLSPTLLNRYVSAAQKISRLAVGRAPKSPVGDTFRMKPDVTQDSHLPNTPLGTRGAMVIPYQFPQAGEYEVQIRLMRDRNDNVESLREPHDLEVSVDRQQVELFSIKPPPRGQSDQSIDANLNARIKVTAGEHNIGVGFLKKSSSLLETERQPLNVHFNFYRHPRIGPALYQVSIVGPFAASGAGDTPSRRRIFVCEPKTEAEEADCARKIIANLARRAYRRPVEEADLEAPLLMYREGRAEGSFELGIEAALNAILVNPQFVLRVERDPVSVPEATAYKISDAELASRLSYFLWSSMPDEELLALAEKGELSRPGVLEKQVRRMLADERANSLVTNFAGQWLYLRNLDSVIPDMRLFPDFDDNLRQALRQETELFFESVVNEDRSALDLLKADYTFLNERLAKHYEIPHVYGSQFRRVALDPASHRGGLLRQGSILTVTSYATRTSPVIRGHWILKNLLNAEPPPPPPNVPTLQDNKVAANLPVRERLKEHRANAQCASCHDLMDPVGFALDNYDAIGRWRVTEADLPIDSAGTLPDGSEFVGVGGLENALLQRPELFVETLTTKLLTFALGRGVEYYDAPAVRKIVRDAKEDNYRFSRLIVGIVTSTPFQMRRTP